MVKTIYTCNQTYIPTCFKKNLRDSNGLINMRFHLRMLHSHIHKEVKNNNNSMFEPER